MPNRYEPTIGRSFAAARGCLFFLGANVFSITVWGQPIPHFERYYDILGWATFVVIAASFVVPADRRVRHAVLLMVLATMLTRAFWWLLFAHDQFTFGQSLIATTNYLVTAVACLLVVTFSEIVQKQRVEYDNLRKSLEATGE